jgi:hypothetical protein
LADLGKRPRRRYEVIKGRDSKALLALKFVETVPELQQLQFSVLQAANVAGVFENHVPTEVAIWKTAAMPYYKYLGRNAVGIKLHSVLGQAMTVLERPTLVR